MDNKKEIKEVIEPLFEEISDLIKKAKQKVQAAINSELVLLYWNIGRKIKTGIMGNQKGEYGKYVVGRLSKKLTLEFGKGYSRASLFRMIRFYGVFPDEQIVATLLRLLSWSHFIELIKIDDSVDHALKACKSTIAVLSDNYLQSGFTKAEWQSAFAKDPTGEKRALIPIRIQRKRKKRFLIPQSSWNYLKIGNSSWFSGISPSMPILPPGISIFSSPNILTNSQVISPFSSAMFGMKFYDFL